MIRGGCDIQGVLLPHSPKSIEYVSKIRDLGVELEAVSTCQESEYDQLSKEIGTAYGWTPKMHLIGNSGIEYTKLHALQDNNLKFHIDDDPMMAYICTDEEAADVMGLKPLPTFLYGSQRPVDDNEYTISAPTWEDVLNGIRERFL